MMSRLHMDYLNSRICMTFPLRLSHWTHWIASKRGTKCLWKDSFFTWKDRSMINRRNAFLSLVSSLLIHFIIYLKILEPYCTETSIQTIRSNLWSCWPTHLRTNKNTLLILLIFFQKVVFKYVEEGFNCCLCLNA